MSPGTNAPSPNPPPLLHGHHFIFLEQGTDMPDLKSLQLSLRSSRIVLGK